MKVLRSLLAAALLAAPAAPASPVQPGDLLDDGLRETLVDALRSGSSLDLDELTRRCTLEHGGTLPLSQALAELAAEESELDAAARRAARRMGIEVSWRRGDLRQAEEACASLVAEGEAGPGLLLDHARLLDARGRTDDALAAYARVLEAELDPEVEARVRLRRALMETRADDAEESALAAHARSSGDADLQNRAAVVLAVLGRPQEAIELYTVTGEGKRIFEGEIRLAEWALRAGDATAAQEAAWRAVRAATLSRDRHYGLGVLVEAHRADESLDALLERFAAAGDELGEAERTRWIALLRETERIDEALALFRSDRAEFSRAEKRELLEMYREAGDDAATVAAFEDLIAREPREVEWREGLARLYLERGERAAAAAVWEPFVRDPDTTEGLLWGAESLMALGLDGLAIEAAERVVAEDPEPYAALLFLHALHADRGRLEAALGTLERMESVTPAEHPARMDLAEAFERAGLLERAVDVLAGVRAARGDDAGEDLVMRLAWLYSEVGREERALEIWRELWLKIESIPRRRYVEDRLMTVASRLGTLADVAIELEERLMAGTADERDSNLLVRLYVKVGDPVSAAEVVDEFMKGSGASAVSGLKEKARVYVACADYYHYEKTISQLIERDPENRVDYLQQLAMSQLERGKPDEARAVLLELRELDGGEVGDEFEAGVLSLAGLRDEAIESYRQGLAKHPERIDAYLLLANLLKEVGETSRAIGMFQYLAETTTHDDMFTVAIDGLLNMEAPPPVLEWARRVTLERLADGGEAKMYLFQLYADVSEELNDTAARLVALEGSLPSAGTRRSSVLRELMDLTSPKQRLSASLSDEDKARHLDYGRRLIGLEELVPPGVYLDLGEAFLADGDVGDAEKTFQLASDLPDYDQFQRDAAGLFDTQGYPREALRGYERVLVSRATDVSLMAKIGELGEQLGRDARSRDLYARAIELLLQRRPLRRDTAEEELSDDPFERMFGARNVDDFQQHHDRLVKGYLTVLPGAEVDAVLAAQRAAVAADLALVRGDEAAATEGEDAATPSLARHPRILHRAGFHRRLALAHARVAQADELDHALVRAFAGDEDLVEDLVGERMRAGLVASARELLDVAELSEEASRRLRFLAGQGAADASAGRLPISETSRLILPRLVAGEDEAAAELVRRTDFAGVEQEAMPALEALFSAARFLEDPDLVLLVGRQWIRLAFRHGTSSYELEPVLDRVGASLDDERRAALYQYLVAQILEDTEKAGGYLTMLPKLQSILAVPLVEEEELMTLFDGYGEDGYGFGLGPALALLPEESRASALRSVWPKIQKTYRASFLLDLPTEIPGAMGAGMAEFVAGAFPEALEDADNIYPYAIQQLCEEEDDVELVAEMHAALARTRPTDVAVRALGVVVADRLGEADAVERAVELYVELVDAPSDDYDSRRARDQMLERFTPEHYAAFEAALDEAIAERTKSVELSMRRVDLARRGGDAELVARALERCAKENPEETAPLEQLYNQRRSRPREALAVLDRLVELEPEKRRWREEQARIWNSLRHPVNALAAREVAEELPEDAESSIPGFPPGFVIPPGAIYIVNGVRYVGGQAPPKADDRRQKPATIKAVYDAAVAEDAELAALTLRRLWRDFKKGEATDPFRFFGYGWGAGRFANLTWPGSAKETEEEADGDAEPEADESAESTEEDPKPRLNRGGLEDFREEDVHVAAQRENAWSALAGYDWGVAEMERFVRTLEPRELDGYAPLCEGLLRARIARAGGAKPVLDELLARRRAGEGGKLEAILILGLLDEDPTLVGDEVRALLDELVVAVNPLDGEQLRRLARVQARSGELEAAVRLYRWCATRTAGSFRYYGDGPQPLDARQLVEEVCEQLEGDARDGLVDAVVAFANPGSARWERENYEVLALETWIERYGAEEAWTRGREMCLAALDFDTGLRRRTAKIAAGLFASAGELERAEEALEVALCKLDAALFSGVTDPYFYFRPDSTGYLSHADLRRLFPAEGAESEPASERGRAWVRRAAAALERWSEEDRVNAASVVDALCVLTRRLVAQGDVELARGLVTRLAARDDLTPAKTLWVVDAAREAGETALADELEERLLADGTLRVQRVHEVVARVLERDGPAAALELGGAAAAWTHSDDLLDVLEGAATEAGDGLAAEAWSAAKAAAAAARERIAELDAAAREEDDVPAGR